MRSLIFNRIEFQNFKNVTKKKIFEFKMNGLYLITGKNGSGKSTIFNAISACLFRKVETNNETIRINDLINETVDKNMHIKLEMSVIDDNNINTDYEINTYYNHSEFKNKTIITIFKDNQQADTIEYKKVDDTIKYIENNIIKYDVFNNIINYYQQNFNTFVTKTDSEQKEFFDYIIGFQFFDELREKAKQKKKNILVKLNDLNNNIQLNNNNIVNYNNLIKEKNEDLQQKLQDLNTSIESLKLQLDEIDIQQINNDILQIDQNMITEQNTYSKNIWDLSSKIDNCNTEINFIDNDIKNEEKEYLNNIKQLNDNFENEKKNIFNKYDSEFQSFLNEKMLQKNNINNKISEINIQIKEYEKIKQKQIFEINENFNNNKNELNNKLNNYNNDIDKKYNNIFNELNNKVNILKFEINNNQSTIEKFDNSLKLKDSICPLCLQEISEEHKPKLLFEKDNIVKINEELLKNINNIQNDIDIFQQEKENNKNIIIDKYNQKLNILNNEKIEKLNNIENEFQNKIDILNNDIKQYLLDIDNIMKEISEKKDNNKEIIHVEINQHEIIFNNNINEIEKKYNTLIKNLKNSLNTLYQKNEYLNSQKIEIDQEFNNKMAQYIDNKNKLNEKIKYYHELENEIKQLHNNKEIYQNETENICLKLKQNISKYEKEIVSLNDMIEKDKSYIDILDFWIDNLGSTGIKSSIISSVLPFINNEINDILKKIPGEPFKVSVFLKESNNNSDMQKFCFEIQNYRSGSIGYKKQSGGEKRIIDFAFLLTLRKLYTTINNIDINIILLDEFFDALDSDNCNSILDLLKILSMDTGVYVITHLEEWKNNQIFDQNFNVGVSL